MAETRPTIQPIAHMPTLRLDRPVRLAWYVFQEFLKGWVLALVVITSVMFLAFGGREFVSSQQSGLLEIVKILPLFLPMTLPYTIPFSLLVATTLTFGRLSADNEIAAMRTAGVNLVSVIAPILAWSLLLSAGIFFLNDLMIPAAVAQRGKMLQKLVESGAVPRLLGARGQSLSLPQSGKTKQSIYMSGLDEHGPFDPVNGPGPYKGVVFHQTEAGKVKTTIFAESAIPTLERETGELRLTFFNATIHRYNIEKPWRAPRVTFRPGAFALAVPAWDTEEEKKLKIRQMSLVQLRVARVERIQKFKKERAKVAKLRAKEKGMEDALADLQGAKKSEARKKLTAFQAYIENTQRMHKRIQRHIWSVGAEIQMRYALALSCLTFALIAIPLGILAKKGNKMVAFLISVLLVIALYYPLVVGGQALAQTGAPVWACVWSANFVLLAIGSVLMHRVIRR